MSDVSAAPFDPTRFWQVGLVVSDIEAVMEELSKTLGLTWGEVKTNRTFGDPQHVVFSREGPPYFELIQGAPGSQWDAANGSRLDHLAYWVSDVSSERERLAKLGSDVVVDGQAKGLPVNYHQLAAAGFRIEIFDSSFKDTIRSNRDLEDVG
jgi:hypothetical protein